MKRILFGRTRPRCFTRLLILLNVTASLLLASGSPCLAAQKRILLLETFDVPIILEHTQRFLLEMQALGYAADSITLIKANGDSQRAESLLQREIDSQRPDIIVANATLAAKVAYVTVITKKIPMVFFVVSDPVGAGIVKVLNEPTHEPVTGIVHSVPRDTKVAMVMHILTPIKPNERPLRFGYIHSSYPSAIGDLRMLREVAQLRGDLEFINYEIPYEEGNFDIQKSLARLIEGIKKIDSQIDYWWIAQDPMGEQEAFIKAIVEHSQHPVVCGTNVASSKNGALVHIMADTATGARETAQIVDQVLKGADIGSIPPHSPTKIDFGVNLSTATKMGVAIPSDLIELAGSQIFY